MIVRELRLRDFRNHPSTELYFGKGLNVLVGENGQGKTNVLEAVAYLGLTKSFTAVTDAAVMRIGGKGFAVEGIVEDGGGRVHVVEVTYDGATGEKQIVIDGSKSESLISVVGRFPVVILAPEHAAISAGAPAERRRFVDLLLSQISRVYLEELVEYRRILRQRNRILAEFRRSGLWDEPTVEPWTQGLVLHGARIVARRREFLAAFRPFVARAHEGLARTGEQPAIGHRSPGIPDEAVTIPEIEKALLRRLQERGAEERRRGLTLAGPHRDDLRFCIDGREVQSYASQGQQKTLLVALKVAEFLYIREQKDEPPAVLLDDVFSELDVRRGQHLLDVIRELGQTIMSTTDENVFHGSVRWNDHHRRFCVVQGTCSRVAAQ
jgi:DNA replication and repair protein RecF